MKHLNLFRSKKKLPDDVKACNVKFENIQIEKKLDRTGFLQAIVGGITRRGMDAVVAPEGSPFDIVLFAEIEEVSRTLTRSYSNLQPVITKAEWVAPSVIERAWQNRVRLDLLKRGFSKAGDKYTLEADIVGDPSHFKKSFRVQASIIQGHPAVWDDPRTRIMIPLDTSSIEQSESMGDESEVRVRVLPRWTPGILVGKVGKKADEMSFNFGDTTLKSTEYWSRKHGINFVRSDDEMLNVHIPLFGQTLPYPRSCIFQEFRKKSSLPEDLKKAPRERVDSSARFVKDYLNQISFLGLGHEFEGPLSPMTLGYAEYAFSPQSAFQVLVVTGISVPVNSVRSALRRYGPYSGKLNGKFIVVHSGNREQVVDAVEALRKSYASLGLGQLELVSDIANGGLIDSGGKTTTDYTSAIVKLRTQLLKNPRKLLALVVLPDVYSADIYYAARGKFFERIFGTEPFHSQAIAYDTLKKMTAEGLSAYPISANTASQCYIKFGGTGTAVWILKDPADSSIPGIVPGSSCYAYHDVSRSPKLKSSATAYSALTDSYGRYIATGTKPVGGEKLTPETFYDILTELILKVSMFTSMFAQVNGNRTFDFRRLVFAKDGFVRDDEAEMMEQIIVNGIPEENKEPIAKLLKRKVMLPKGLVIDIIGVNKSPNKRIFEVAEGIYRNVADGTALAFDENEGLLVSSTSAKGTVQPIEISLKKHVCLNVDVPRPHIKQLIDEYHRLTHLNWASIFRQGKYALPQILTQNLGENISAGVHVPDDMILL